MTDKITQKEQAYITYTDEGVKIHIGTLTIDLVADSETAGLLGHPEQDPGVIFWQSEYAEYNGQFYEHGKQRPIGFENLDKMDVESIISELNEADE